MAESEEKPFAVERAKSGRSKCKKCKIAISKDEVRIAKLMANPFGEGKMKCWHHVTCIFEVFAKQRATTKKIDDPEEDIEGWHELCPEDKQVILDKLQEFEDAEPYKAKNKTPLKKVQQIDKQTNGASTSKADDEEKKQDKPKDKKRKAALEKVPNKKTKNDQDLEEKKTTRDDMFVEFQRICASLSSTPGYVEKTALIKNLFEKGSEADKFKGDILLWCSMLLPKVEGRIYNLQSKQLVKLFSRILVQDEDEMLEHLEQGDIAETIKVFFESSIKLRPKTKSVLTMQEVHNFLIQLSEMTKEEDQIQHFESIIDRCTSDDLKTIIRLIKHDLRIKAGPKHILGAIHDDAYAAFQTSQDLSSVVQRFMNNIQVSTQKIQKSPDQTKVTLSLMTPVLPMLAEACKSVDTAVAKCPQGMLSEVKYDGERVQVHKQGSDFKYFSRSLKPVMAHKVKFLQDYLPKAFPTGNDLILDSEVLLIDTNTAQPLPFGSLGKHKKEEFKDANVCLFVFDCIYFNGKSLTNKSMKERRKILEDNITPIPNRVVLSEVQMINKAADLTQMIVKVLKLGLEGLVLKDINGKYEPGKRHWLKVKKDYLCGGAMADSADLVVLGAWYGTGVNGGKKSIFLMGCYDNERDVWLTVTKVHGFDDETLAKLQDQMKDMIKIGKDPKLVPKWLKVNKPMVPDFIAQDPKTQPVWEIAGAEFTNQGVHTADGISIRFPRVMKIREDKDWETATNFNELRQLFKRSSEDIDFSLLVKPSTSPTEIKNMSKKPRDESTSPKGIPKKRLKTEEKVPKKLKLNFGEIKTEIKDETEPVQGETVVKAETKVKIEKIKEESSELVQVKLEDKESCEEEARKAEYYCFLGTNYIEYTRNGSPLNWIKDQKPPEGLPKQARPISERSDAQMRGRCVLRDVYVKIGRDMKKPKRKELKRTLKTLGAIIVKDEIDKITHVIHSKSRLPATILNETNEIPKTAVHVTESWVEETIARRKMPNCEPYVVTLFSVNCECPCRHMR